MPPDYDIRFTVQIQLNYREHILRRTRWSHMGVKVLETAGVQELGPVGSVDDDEGPRRYP